MIAHLEEFKTISTIIEDGCLIIEIDREDKMNALNLNLIEELGQVMDYFYKHKELNGAIITGKGNKAFAAGADISEFTGFSSAQGIEMSRAGHNVFNKIENAPKPVIAAVNGFALGGGCELAMACHLRVASPNAKFGQPEITLGIIPGYGGTQRLVQLIGKGKALELLMTGEMIDAEEAYKLGLVNYVVENDALTDKAKELIKKISKKAPLAIRSVICSVNAYFHPRKDGFEHEIEQFSKCMGTEDFTEGTSAFLEKRKAEFKGK
ncbi:MAG: enoyl-CoA hydratase [Chitinophagales bacterium]|nr:enoyl-CoA hydratase [Chitinophagales bacterium]